MFGKPKVGQRVEYKDRTATITHVYDRIHRGEHYGEYLIGLRYDQPVRIGLDRVETEDVLACHVKLIEQEQEKAA